MIFALCVKCIPGSCPMVIKFKVFKWVQQWRECFNSTDVKLALSHSYKKYVHLQGVSKNLFEVRLPIVK